MAHLIERKNKECLLFRTALHSTQKRRKKKQRKKDKQKTQTFRKKYKKKIRADRRSSLTRRLLGEDKGRSEPCMHNQCRAMTSTISRARSPDQNYRKRITNRGADSRRSQTPRWIRLREQTTRSMRVMFMSARLGRSDAQLEARPAR